MLCCKINFFSKIKQSIINKRLQMHKNEAISCNSNKWLMLNIVRFKDKFCYLSPCSDNLRTCMTVILIAVRLPWYTCWLRLVPSRTDLWCSQQNWFIWTWPKFMHNYYRYLDQVKQITLSPPQEELLVTFPSIILRWQQLRPLVDGVSWDYHCGKVRVGIRFG